MEEKQSKFKNTPNILNKIPAKHSKTHHKDTNECFVRTNTRCVCKNDCRASFISKPRFTKCIGFMNNKMSVMIAINNSVGE